MKLYFSRNEGIGTNAKVMDVRKYFRNESLFITMVILL